MCLACEMEAMWFAAMEERARAVAAEAAAPLAEPTLPASVEVAALLPPLEKGTVGEGIAGGERGADGESVDPLPSPPPEEGGASRRFSCEETPSE